MFRNDTSIYVKQCRNQFLSKPNRIILDTYLNDISSRLICKYQKLGSTVPDLEFNYLGP